jgi:hypothetical protein
LGDGKKLSALHHMGFERALEARRSRDMEVIAVTLVH